MRAVRAGVGCSEPMIGYCMGERLWVEAVLRPWGDGGGGVWIWASVNFLRLPFFLNDITTLPPCLPSVSTQNSGFRHEV